MSNFRLYAGALLGVTILMITTSTFAAKPNADLCACQTAWSVNFVQINYADSEFIYVRDKFTFSKELLLFEGNIEGDECHSFYLNIENIYSGGYCGYDSGVVDGIGDCYVENPNTPIALYLTSQDMIDCGSALRALVKEAK